tara:strand:- start:269 stop:475 length:207 start_codon:yes stop_codon:yes gene_type:complete
VDEFTQYEIVLIAISLVGGWLKFQADYNKLAARVKFLEGNTAEFRADLKQLLQDIQEIKVLLAKNKVE